MKVFSILATMVALVLLSAPVHSQGIMGSDWEWDCLGNDSFRLTLIVYKECGSSSMSDPYIAMRKSKDTAIHTLVGYFTMSLQSSMEVTPICSSACSNCKTCPSTKTKIKYGVERRVYTSVVNASSMVKSGDCKVKFWFGGSGITRASSITTGGKDKDFHTEAYFDVCRKYCNNSVKFTTLPVILVPKERDIEFYPGAYGLDANAKNKILDSLKFSFVEPKTSPNTNLGYSSPYSYDKPIYFAGFPTTTKSLPEGFHLDRTDGTMRFRPMKEEVTVMSFRVTEFRNAMLVGVVRREMMVIVLKAARNSSPVISHANCGKSSTLTLTACKGSTVSFSVCTSDSNSRDSLSLRLLSSPVPGAKFTVSSDTTNRPQGVVSFTVSDAEYANSPLFFDFEVSDNTCPVAAKSSKRITVYIKQPPTYNVTLSDSLTNSSCPVRIISASGLNTTKVKNYRWLVDSNIVADRTLTYAMNPTFGDTQLITFAYYNSTCWVYDSKVYTIPKSSSSIKFANPHDSFICSGEPYLDTIVASGGTGKLSYQWYDTHLKRLYKSDNIKLEDTLYAQPFIRRIRITATDTLQCSFTHEIELKQVTNQSINYLNDTVLCTDSIKRFKLPVGPAGNSWLNNGQWVKSFANKGKLEGKYSYVQWLKRDGECFQEDFSLLWSKMPYWSLLDDTIFTCTSHDTIPLRSSTSSTIWSGPGVVKGQALFFLPNNPAAIYPIKAISSNAYCSDSANLYIITGGVNSINWSADSISLCSSERDTALPIGGYRSIRFSGGKKLLFVKKGQYHIDLSKLQPKQYISGSMTDSNYCKDAFNMLVRYKGSFPITLGSPSKAMCLGSGLEAIVTSPVALSWTGGVVDADTAFYFDTDGKQPGNYLLMGKFGNGQCVSYKSFYVSVADTYLVSLRVDTSLCTGDTFVFKKMLLPGYWEERYGGVTVDNGTPSQVVFGKGDTSTYYFAYKPKAPYTVTHCYVMGADVMVRVGSGGGIQPNIKDSLHACAHAELALDGQRPNTEWSGPGVVEKGGYYYFNPDRASGTVHALTKKVSSGSCHKEGQTHVRTISLPTVYAGDDTVLCLGTDTFEHPLRKSAKGSWTGHRVVGGQPLTAFYPLDPRGEYHYGLSATNAYGCTGADTLVIYVGDRVEVAYAASPSKGAAPLTVHFRPTGTGGVYHKWFFGTGDYSNLDTPVYTYQNIGKYTVRLISTDGTGYCSDEATFPDAIEATPVGLSKSEGMAMPAIFPNPSSGAFNLLCPPSMGYLVLRLYDAQGREVETLELGQGGTVSFGHALPKGLYLAALVDKEGETLTQTVAKE
ncbi:MAG: hypothetical protein HYZ16_05525 [Bacteroidetes bacterium]|nr:hypothetical protein [Bacteroidota bacterium]